MELRPAAIQDIPLISRIHAASWKAAYVGMVPQAYIDTLPEDYWVEPFAKWFRAGELEGIIAWEGDAPVGCISFGNPVSVPDLGLKELPEACGEVRSLYIHPDHMRRGYGKALLQAAELSFRIRGYSYCCLYTLEENKIARAFYEKNGYVIDGGTGSYEIAGKAITDLRYIKSLACPCPRRCKTHGDCTACTQRHKKKKHPCYCLRRA